MTSAIYTDPSDDYALPRHMTVAEYDQDEEWLMQQDQEHDQELDFDLMQFGDCGEDE